MRTMESLGAFSRRVLLHPAPVVAAIMFVSSKIWGNVSYGGSYANGLRSGIMGVLMYGLAMIAVEFLSTHDSEDTVPEVEPGKLRIAVFGVLICYALIFMRIIDTLQRGTYLSGTPIFNFIPGYSRLYAALSAVPGGYRVTNILRGLPLYVIAPWLVLRYLDLKPDTWRRVRKDIKPALPFLLIYVVAFAVGGVTAERLVFLGYALLYAGIQEEFFFRGIMQPLLIARMKNPIWAMFVGALLFGLLHIPDFALRLYPTVPLALSNAASVTFFGALMGFGVYKTGLLWPWMIVHALSNVVGW
jgi:membrane protease YdiL (CAAX protease family)